MFYGSNPYRKDNPRWLISNAAETTKVPGHGSPVLMPAPASGHHLDWHLPRGIAVIVIERAGSACGIAGAWLIGLPRRAGRRLHAVNDAEARQWGWQVIERDGGLVHQYRDARFDALRYEPALRRDELRDDAYHGDSAQPPPVGRSSGGDV